MAGGPDRPAPRRWIARSAAFAPLFRNRAFRLYYPGNALSLIGTWMQRICQEWLVLEITGSGIWLGIIAALQFLPLLVASPWGGAIADRADRRRLIIATQVLSGLMAAVLGALTLAGAANVWSVGILALLLGLVSVVDSPARRSFVSDLVPPELVHGAVVLQNMTSNVARTVGPLMGAAIIASVGTGWAFMANAGTYIGVVVSLSLISDEALRPSPRLDRQPRQVRDGIRYVIDRPDLRDVVVMMGAAGVGAFGFSVTLPLLATRELGLGAGALGLLNAGLGVGAILGGLALTRPELPSADDHLRWGAGFGLAVCVAATAPTLLIAVAVLSVTGMLSIQFIATSTAFLQTSTHEHFRGRAMALWGMAFVGTRPIGSVLLGIVGETWGARAALASGGLLTSACGLLLLRLRRGRAQDSAG